MLTVQPVLLRGRSGLALPAREFASRVASVQVALGECGADALAAYGDARSYAPLAWLVGLVPMLGWAVAVVPSEGPVELYTASAARDVTAMRALAAVDAVAAVSVLPAALAARRRVALAGMRAMRATTEDAIRGSGAEILDGDGLVAELMATPSAGERELLRAAANAAASAAAAVERSHLAGASAADALLDGDLEARLAGMQDARVLWSSDGGRTLRPLTGAASARVEVLAFYIAVQTGGYWGDALRSTGRCATLPAGLAPIARLGLDVVEGVAEPLRSGVHSVRELDATGAWSSRTVEVP
jgi:Xaa-Pro aminopeptidase